MRLLACVVLCLIIGNVCASLPQLQRTHRTITSALRRAVAPFQRTAETSVACQQAMTPLIVQGGACASLQDVFSSSLRARAHASTLPALLRSSSASQSTTAADDNNDENIAKLASLSLATIESLCGSCLPALESVMFSDACKADASSSGLDMASLSKAFGLICLKRDNEYCLPKFAQMSTLGTQLKGDDSLNNITETQFSLLCSPCVGELLNYVFTMMKTDTTSTVEKNEAMDMLSALCVKDDDNKWCLMKMRADLVALQTLEELSGTTTAGSASNTNVLVTNEETTTTTDKRTKLLQTANVLKSMCGSGLCFKRLMSGLLSVSERRASTVAEKAKVANTEAFVASMCVRESSNSDTFCGAKVLSVAAEFADDKSCAPVTELGDSYPATCISSYGTQLAKMGCCAGVFINALPTATRANIITAVDNITACETRVKRALPRMVFRNLKHSWYLQHKEECESKVKTDVAAAAGVSAAAVELVAEPLTLSGVAFALQSAAMAEQGVVFTGTVTYDSDTEASKATPQMTATLSHPSSFKSISALPAAASIDGTTTFAPAVNTNAASSRFTALSSFVLLLVAAVLML